MMNKTPRTIALAVFTFATAMVVAGCFAIANLDRFRERGPEGGTDSTAPGAMADSSSGEDSSGSSGGGPSSGGSSGGSSASGGSSGTSSSGVSSSDAGSSDAGTYADAAQADGSSGTYYALGDPTRWTFFDAVGVANHNTKYSGVAFDGRYLYFVPQFSPPNVLRFDTQGGFTNPASWTYYSPIAAILAAGGSTSGNFTYLGGAFDGRYVYLAPFGMNTYAVRYDTQRPFAQDTSWSGFNTGTMDPSANYWGVLSDGRYAYFIPNKTTKVVVYDNAAGGGDAGSDFTATASWIAYDLGTGNQGYWGGAYDGTYVYFAPFSGSVAARHDAVLPIAAAWDVGATGFDFNNNFLLGATAHFWGGAYDGNRVYMVPNQTQGWTLAAYATSGQFSDYGSWTACPLTPLFSGATSGQAFVGAAFDGKRLFLVPYGGPVGDSGTSVLPMVAYDTTQPLCPADLTTAYSRFDPTGLDGGMNAKGFEGAAFDGQYVYFVPHTGSVVARFEAKSTNMGLQPRVYKGSWW